MNDPGGIDASFAKEALERCGDALLAIDLAGPITWANDAVALIGWTPADLVGREIAAIVSPADLDQLRQGARAIARGFHLPSSVPMHLLRPDGSAIECDLASWTVTDADGHPAVMMHVRPTQDSRILRDLLHRLLNGEPAPVVLESLLDLLYHRSTWVQAVVLLVDPDGGELVIGSAPHPTLAGVDAEPGSPWALVRSGAEPEVTCAIAELPPAVAAHAGDAGFRECWVVPVHAGGELIALVTAWALDAQVSVRLDPYSVRLLAQLIELVWRWWRQTLALERAATLDPLTGLANRRALEGPTATAGAFTRGVLYVDLDRFKPVNDLHGHGAGDQVLRTVAHRLLACVRPTDRVMRLGGDEFGVVVPGCSRDELAEVAGRIIARVEEPIAVPGATVQIGGSVGAALGTGSEADLFERADAALYEAKSAGRGQLRWAADN
jgi:diguanylate cyclase (GGDEF)-like protein/PAS domain S-box-containing protein